MLFLSTLSLRRATTRKSQSSRTGVYFYPRSPCGERQQTQRLKIAPHGISIHALLAESDPSVLHNFRPLQISIHALLAESDGFARPLRATEHKFLSTLSLRRATTEEVSGDTWQRDFYPRSPCGERQSSRAGWLEVVHYFYPRSPCGERRWIHHAQPAANTISIHALLAESDTLIWDVIAEMTISIHALLAESDTDIIILDEYQKISIHALLAESDASNSSRAPPTVISIHALLAESDCNGGEKN